MADSVDWGQAEDNLKQKAGQWYDSSMLDDLKRNAAAGQANNEATQATVDDWTNRIANKAQLRGSNESNSTYVADGQGGVTVGPTGKVNNPNGDGPSTLGNGNGGNGSGSGSSGGPSPSVPAASNPAWTSLFNQLMDRSKQSLAVNPNDPTIRAQVDPATAAATGQMRKYLEGQAESGGPYNNMTGETRMANENVAQGASNLTASLIGNELTQRRTEIQNALAQMGGMLTADQSNALQQELGLINANIAQQGIGIQQQQINSGNDQFAQTFGLNATNQANYWDALRSGQLG